MKTLRSTPALGALVLLTSCGGYDNDQTPTPMSPEQEAMLLVKAYVQEEMVALFTAASALQSGAPTPDSDGWSAAADGDAVDALKERWREARVAYEHIEGAVAILFPDLDYSMDQRYDAFVQDLGQADPDLFDGEGVTGIHGIERILWADSIPAEVVEFEQSLGSLYTPASFPTTEEEAAAFRDGLCSRLVEDADQLVTGFTPLALDPSSAFRGVIGSVEEQVEKVNLASFGQDESRYAQYTLGDMRANLEGGLAIYSIFQEWLTGLEGGTEIDAAVLAGFARVDAAYDQIAGDAIPPVPAGWNPDAPSEEHLATPYGQLFSLLSYESDPNEAGSLTYELDRAADLLGIPALP